MHRARTVARPSFLLVAMRGVEGFQIRRLVENPAANFLVHLKDFCMASIRTWIKQRRQATPGSLRKCRTLLQFVPGASVRSINRVCIIQDNSALPRTTYSLLAESAKVLPQGSPICCAPSRLQKVASGVLQTQASRLPFTKKYPKMSLIWFQFISTETCHVKLGSSYFWVESKQARQASTTSERVSLKTSHLARMQVEHVLNARGAFLLVWEYGCLSTSFPQMQVSVLAHVMSLI